MRRSKHIFILLILLTSISASVAGQPRAATKEEYDREFEKSREAMTYPYRQTITIGAYTDFGSAEALHTNDGTKVRSKVVVIEYSRADRLRITSETNTDKGMTMIRQMQIHSDCYTFVGSKWRKNTESCGDAVPLTIGVAPQKEEYFIERTNLDGAPVTVFRYVQTNKYTGSEESSFVTDSKGRLIRREDSSMVRVYDYGVKFPPIVVPRPKGPPRPRRSTKKLGLRLNNL